jgi:hypothetical protein
MESDYVDVDPIDWQRVGFYLYQYGCAREALKNQRRINPGLIWVIKGLFIQQMASPAIEFEASHLDT